MNRLIKSNLTSKQRIKTSLFCLLFIAAFEVIILIVLNNMQAEVDEDIYADGVISFAVSFFGFLTAVITSSIGGNDYKDGTIRNKLVAGFTRAQIYFSNFVTSVICGVVFYVINFIFTVLISMPFFKLGAATEGNVSEFYIRNLALGLFPLIGSIALCNLLVMINSSKTKGLILCLGATYIFTVIAASVEPEKLLPKHYNLKDVPTTVAYYESIIPINLDALEEREGYEFERNEYGEIDYSKLDSSLLDIEMTNDDGIKEPTRTIFVLLEDVLPEYNFSRIFYDIDTDFHYCLIHGVNHRVVYVMLNICYIALLNAIGYLIFKKRRLK